MTHRHEIRKIYIAGPAVFLPNASEVLSQYSEICREHGFEGLTPFDTVPTAAGGIDRAREIFLSNMELIRKCDFVIADCNSFRGACIDDGTAWEIGYGFSTDKIILGYRNRLSPLPENAAEKIRTFPHKSGYRIDENGYLLNEDFGNTVNLMLEFSIEKSGGVLLEGKFADAVLYLKRHYG